MSHPIASRLRTATIWQSLSFSPRAGEVVEAAPPPPRHPHVQQRLEGEALEAVVVAAGDVLLPEWEAQVGESHPPRSRAIAIDGYARDISDAAAPALSTACFQELG